VKNSETDATKIQRRLRGRAKEDGISISVSTIVGCSSGKSHTTYKSKKRKKLYNKAKITRF
jgi:hypothetical protein